MNLYRGVVEHQLDKVEWDFEALDEAEAMAIVDHRASSILVTILKKKLYLIGKRIK